MSVLLPTGSEDRRFCGDVVTLCCAVLFWITCAVSLVFLWQNRGVPILDMHGFRQTQTAISAYWMLQEGTILPYQTPVFGHPWLIPYEFPLYQMLAAGLSALGVPLDYSGRLVSYAFFLLLLVPVRFGLKAFRLSDALFYIFASLYVSSPAYLFWGRAFLIETTALFFCLAGAILLILRAKQRNRFLLLAATGCLTLGALVKATTYPQCILFALGLAGLVLIEDKTLPPGRRLKTFALLFGAALLPVFVTFLWVRYCDSLKLASPMGAVQTSEGLTGWYSMDLGLLLRQANLLPVRILQELPGKSWVVYLCLPLSLLAGARTFLMVCFLLLCFFFPMLLFSRVHVIHNYYQISNGIFLIFAVAVSIHALAKVRLRALIPLVLLACIIVNYNFFFNYFYKIFLNTAGQGNNHEILKIASALKANTDPHGIVFIFGRDWNPEIPYYSQRKSVMLPHWLPPAMLQNALSDPKTLTGNAPLEATLVCPDGQEKHPAYDQTVDAFLHRHFSLDHQTSVGDCTIYSTTQAASP